MNRVWFSVVALFALFCAGWGVEDNPYIGFAQTLGERGLSVAKAPSKVSTKYKPSSSRPGVERWIKALEVPADQAEETRRKFIEVIDAVQEEARKSNFDHDVAYAYASTLIVLQTLVSEVPPPDEAIPSLTATLQSAFDAPSLRSATDADRQEAAEYALGAMQIILITAKGATDEDGMKKLKDSAAGMIKLLVGADASQIKMDKGALSIKGSQPANTSAGSNGAMAPGFTFTKPGDWEKEGDWYTFRKRSNDSSDVRSAMIRFLPAVPATKNGGVILTELWKTAIPSEIPRAGGMVFRRYVGNNNPAWFVYGKGLEKGKDADTLFTLMIVDCGTHWQPLVIAQTYEDPSSFKTGIQMSASFSYGQTADFAEVMLKLLSCKSTSGKPLIDREGISAKFHFGNYSSMDYVNVYTGASSTSYVTYGGDLTLKPDGNFTYAYSSASSNGGGASFGKADGYGKYTIEGEYLICRFTEHNQWSSTGGFPSKLKDSVYTYKIGGLTNFADGTKIAVLIQVPPNRPINAVTVGDSSNWFSTKKKD